MSTVRTVAVSVMFVMLAVGCSDSDEEAGFPNSVQGRWKLQVPPDETVTDIEFRSDGKVVLHHKENTVFWNGQKIPAYTLEYEVLKVSWAGPQEWELLLKPLNEKQQREEHKYTVRLADQRLGFRVGWKGSEFRWVYYSRVE